MQTLSRYQESGDKLITPISAGLELKAKCWWPIANSATRAEAASRLDSSRRARYSSVSIFLRKQCGRENARGKAKGNRTKLSSRADRMAQGSLGISKSRSRML